jgi:flavin reductase (DIM6/NTAB) family NADH-FMN oxidoreductase RutF
MTKQSKIMPAYPAPTIALACGNHPAARDAVPASQFTGAMSTLAASVTVVAAGHGAERHGRTVTAMLSLSAEPPSVLVSITRDTDLGRTIEASGGFSLSVLAEDQRAVADAFAGWGPADRFADADWSQWASCHPKLDGAVASFDCVLGGAIEMDTHVLYAGIVMHTASFPDRAPLLWHRRGYGALDKG